jgi:hypothetical protein
MDEMEGKMAEKKRRIIKQIFKWLGLGLLVALIMGALIYDAPWKVLALLLIILAACTILPKPARKWFWLSVAAVVVVLIIWVFLPDVNGGWRPYTFDEEFAALQAKYAIPDNENAALLYSKLFETLDTDSNAPEFFNSAKITSTDGPWLSKDHPETAEWLKGHQKTIDTLLEISRIEKCSFPIVATLIDPEYMKYGPKMRRCAFLLLSAANNDMAEDRTDAGLEKYLCIIQLSKHIHQQHALVDLMVGFAVEGLAFKQLKRFMIEGQPSKEQLQLMANSLKDLENNWCSDFNRRLDYEKLLFKNIISLFYEINRDREGKVRLSRNPTATFRALFPQETQPPPTFYGHRKLTKASVIVGWLFWPPKPHTVSKAIDETYEKYYAMADPNFDWSKKPPEVQPQLKLNFRYIIEFLTNMSGQAHSSIHEIYLRHLAGRRGSRLLAAISQYKIENNAWPANLDAVKSLAPAEAFIDPVGGKQFEYQISGNRFFLYGETVNIWPK